MKRKFIAVIGNGSAGKSTIIQSLTGCPTRSYCGRVTDRLTGKEIEVIASSPQEKPIAEEKLRRMLKYAAKRRKSAGMVIAVRPSETTKRLSMEEIFTLAASFRLAPYGFVLSPAHKRNSRPVNLSEVRNRLAPSSVPIQAINGKRFAHINASIIRDTAGLF
jgi:energy-coupling factor transporter ATP-binding protein EcfA2